MECPLYTNDWIVKMSLQSDLIGYSFVIRSQQCCTLTDKFLTTAVLIIYSWHEKNTSLDRSTPHTYYHSAQAVTNQENTICKKHCVWEGRWQLKKFLVGCYHLTHNGIAIISIKAATIRHTRRYYCYRYQVTEHSQKCMVKGERSSILTPPASSRC